MICLADDVRCLVFICSPLLMAIFVLHFILFAEGRLSFLFSLDVWFVLRDWSKSIGGGEPEQRGGGS